MQMKNFEQLVTSRREWIDKILIPWCKTATRRDLLLAEQEWTDLAGRPDPEMTLWRWAWQRFPHLSHPVQPTLDESQCVTVRCHDGREVTGYPEARMSQAGLLFLVTESGQTVGPINLDDVSDVELVT